LRLRLGRRGAKVLVVENIGSERSHSTEVRKERSEGTRSLKYRRGAVTYFLLRPSEASKTVFVLASCISFSSSYPLKDQCPLIAIFFHDLLSQASRLS